MSVQTININQTRSAALQDNKKLLSVKQYSDYVEKTYLAPATTTEQKLTPTLYSAICPGLGQYHNGDTKKAYKIGGIGVSMLPVMIGGLYLAAKEKSGKKGLISGFVLMGLSMAASFTTWMYSVVDAYKNAKTQIVEITKNESK